MGVEARGLGVCVGTVADGCEKGIETHIENPPIIYTDLRRGNSVWGRYAKCAGHEAETSYPQYDCSDESRIHGCDHVFLPYLY